MNCQTADFIKRQNLEFDFHSSGEFQVFIHLKNA